MVYMGKSFGDIVSGRKSTTDFMNQAQEEERLKRAQAMQEQMMPLQLEQAKLGLDKTQLDMEKLRHEMSQPQTPFTGKGTEADMLRAAYRQNIIHGFDPVTSEQRSYDQLLGTKVTTQLVKHPVTGQYTIVDKPRKPMFGVGDGVMQDPMEAHQEALNQQVGEIGANPFQNTVNLDPQEVNDQLSNMNVGQGGVVPGAPGVSMQPVANEPEPQQNKLPTTAWEAAKLGTGPKSAVMSGLTYGAGFIGQDFAEDEPYIESRQILNLAAQELTKALQQNPRYAEGERVSIKDEISGILNPSFWRGHNVAYRQMRLLNHILENRMQRAIRDSQDGSQTPEYRKSQANAAASMARFLETLGVPKGGQEDGSSNDIDSLINMYAD